MSVLNITFRGIDEGSDPKTQPPGSLALAQNCAMDKARRLTKRAGTVGLSKARSDAGSITAGKRLVPYPSGDVGLVDGPNAFNRVTQSAKWAPIQALTPFSVQSRSFCDAARSVRSVDLVITGDLILMVFATAPTGGGAGGVVGRTYFQVLSRVTGQLVLAPKLLPNAAAGPHVRILLGATKAYVVWSAAGGIIQMCSVNLTTFALSSLATPITDAGTTERFDAVIGSSSNGEVIYVAYELAAGLARVQVTSFLTSTFAQDHIATPVGGTSTDCVSLAFCPLANRVAVLRSDVDSVLVAATVLTVDLALVADAGISAANVRADSCFVAERDSTHLVIGYVTQFGSGPGYVLITGLLTIAGFVLPAATVRQSQNLYQTYKPWVSGGRWFVATTVYVPGDLSTFNAISQMSVVVVEILFVAGASGATAGPHPQIATLENLTGLFWGNARSAQLKVAVDAGGTIWTPAPYRLREPLNDAGVNVEIGWNLHALTPVSFQIAANAAGMLASCAAPIWFDGASAMPYGFQHAPNIVTITPTAGGSQVAGTYSYVACYVWEDANGVLHRSLQSPPVTGTAAGGNLSMTLLVACTTLSAKQDSGFLGSGVANPVMIELYRTTVGGTVHHKLIATTAINDPQARSVSILDVSADANVGPDNVPLATQAVVYTETGELGNIPPPPLLTVIAHGGRFAGIDSWKRTVWLTKNQTEDVRIAPGFNEALVLGFPSDKVALASLDEKLVVFGTHDIHVVFGEGPDATGAGAWQVQRLQTDVGCINAQSVAVCPLGPVFLSSRGVEMLSRSLEVSWIGQVIEDTLAAFPTITSATLVADAHEVRFTCNAANGATGIVLAWDYLHQIWFTRRYKDSSDTLAANIPFVDAAMVNGVYTLLTAAGQVYQETTAHKLDGGVDFVARDIVLAWLSPASPMNWHRIKDVSLMGTSLTDHDMTIQVAQDFATTYGQAKTFLAQSAPVAIGPLAKCRVTMATQKCRAVKIRIQELAPTAPGVLSTGDGAILEGVAFRVTTKAGPAKTTAAEQG